MGDWNDLPDSLITSVESPDDCVSKFTSLVRAKGTNLPCPGPLLRYCYFGVAPVNYSDSDKVWQQMHRHVITE